jgi:hypothetical protein
LLCESSLHAVRSFQPFAYEQQTGSSKAFGEHVRPSNDRAEAKLSGRLIPRRQKDLRSAKAPARLLHAAATINTETFQTSRVATPNAMIGVPCQAGQLLRSEARSALPNLMT